jgi:hypothetical protein
MSTKLIFEGGPNDGELFTLDPTNDALTPISLQNGGYLPNQGQADNETNAIGPVLLSYGGKSYIQGEDASGATALYVYDGSRSAKETIGVVGTGVNSNSNGLDPVDFVEYSSKVYFNGESSDGTPDDPRLWVTNGTAAGTHEVANSPLNPDYMASFNGNLYMNAEGANNSQDLFVYNSEKGKFMDISKGLNPTEITQAAHGTFVLNILTGQSDLNNNPPRELFMEGSAGGKTGLFVYDGSGSPIEISGTKGTNPEDIIALSMPAQPSFWSQDHGDLVQYNGVVFSGIGPNGDRGLWFSDGTAGGTREIPGSSSLDPYDITVADGGTQIYFTGDDGGAGGAGRGLFVYLPNFNVVEEILKSSQYNFAENFNNNNNNTNFGNANPNTLTVENNHLYFSASKSGGPTQLYELATHAGAFTGTLVASNSTGLNPTSLTHT